MPADPTRKRKQAAINEQYPNSRRHQERGVHLDLGRKASELELNLAALKTIGAIIDFLGSKHPVLKGANRDQMTGKRRPFIRFFACKEDLSDAPGDTVLPEAVRQGLEPFMIIGAMAGG